MPKYEVDVGKSTYEVEAPDEKTAWRWANQYHEKSQAYNKLVERSLEAQEAGDYQKAQILADLADGARSAPDNPANQSRLKPKIVGPTLEISATPEVGAPVSMVDQIGPPILAIVLGMLTFWTINRKLWGRVRNTPHELGTWVGGWSVAFITVGTLADPKIIFHPAAWDAMLFFNGVGACVLAGIVGYAAGWIYRRFNPSLKSNQSSDRGDGNSVLVAVPQTESSSPASGAKSRDVKTSQPASLEGSLGANEDPWEAALAEFEGEDRKKGIWAKCFANSDGDEQRAKAMYLRERVAEMSLAASEIAASLAKDKEEGLKKEAIGKARAAMSSDDMVDFDECVKKLGAFGCKVVRGGMAGVEWEIIYPTGIVKYARSLAVLKFITDESTRAAIPTPSARKTVSDEDVRQRVDDFLWLINTVPQPRSIVANDALKNLRRNVRVGGYEPFSKEAHRNELIATLKDILSHLDSVAEKFGTSKINEGLGILLKWNA